MKGKRRKFSGELKAKVALDAMSGRGSANELASKYEVHPNQVSQWKKQLVDGAAELFSERGAKRRGEEEELQAKLYEQIGRLQIELNWLKKTVSQ